MIIARVFVTGVFLVTFMTAGHAQSLNGVAFSRDVDGQPSIEAVQNLERLRQAAANSDRINVWITFDMPHEANPALRTAASRADEAIVRQGLIESIVLPIVNRNHAKIIELPVPPIDLPGCMLSVSLDGLNQLAANPKVILINYISG